MKHFLAVLAELAELFVNTFNELHNEFSENSEEDA